MTRVLILLDRYLPGYKAGGSLRTVANLVEGLGDRFGFWILTRDRDTGDDSPYPGIEADAWNEVGRAKVCYASRGSFSLSELRRVVREVGPDVIHINSLFSTRTIGFLTWRRLGLLPDLPAILAPRGELSPGALRLKAGKKRLYLAVALRAGLYRRLVWQASSVLEEQDIRRIMGPRTDVHVAPDIPPRQLLTDGPPPGKPEKVPGRASFVFLSRISPKKNLLQALELLQGTSGDVSLDIFGPIGDRGYWGKCRELMAAMPGHVRVSYGGPVPYEQVGGLLSRHHFFILPTLGENFGYVILEALGAGCPVLVADQTPWRDLAARQAGWDLPLDRPDRWRDVLQQCVRMDGDAYARLSRSSRDLAASWVSSSSILEESIALFERVAESRDKMGSRGGQTS